MNWRPCGREKAQHEIWAACRHPEPALDKPRHDIFYLEEEEMLDVLRRFFSKEYQKSVREDSSGDQLTERWQEAIEDLRYNTESDAFDLPLFKTLLVDTWQYFIDTVDDFASTMRICP